jgi:NADH-quinone oxidoreductase subunit E
MAFTLSPEFEKLVDDLLKRYPTKQAGCIPLLHLCQREAGWASPQVIDYVARRLEMSTSQVKGVVTFYTMFQQRPMAPNVIWVCRTLACELRGGRSIQQHLEKRLGCTLGETSQDGQFTLLSAECLAACGQGPAIQVNDQYYENLTIEKLDAIIEKYTTDKPKTRAATA